jgi:hypothetical protein
MRVLLMHERAPERPRCLAPNAGYTAANFSGRMPCTELADAIVSSGKDTLERAIAMVNAHPEWRAKVCA